MDSEKKRWWWKTCCFVLPQNYLVKCQLSPFTFRSSTPPPPNIRSRAQFGGQPVPAERDYLLLRDAASFLMTRYFSVDPAKFSPLKAIEAS